MNNTPQSSPAKVTWFSPGSPIDLEHQQLSLRIEVAKRLQDWKRRYTQRMLNDDAKFRVLNN